jgi:hypothetical protein
MLYLHPEAKRKFREIAFYEERKEHDVYVEALRDYLEKRGHLGLRYVIDSKEDSSTLA